MSLSANVCTVLLRFFFRIHKPVSVSRLVHTQCFGNRKDYTTYPGAAAAQSHMDSLRLLRPLPFLHRVPETHTDIPAYTMAFLLCRERIVMLIPPDCIEHGFFNYVNLSLYRPAASSRYHARQ